MKKKWLIGLMLTLSVATFSGCSTGKPQEEGSTKTSEKTSEVSRSEKEQLYIDLSYYGKNPDIMNSTSLNGTLDFVARVGGEVEKLTFDEKPGEQPYVPVLLARDLDTPLYLNLSKLKEENYPAVGDVIEIKGEVLGYIYSTYENERINVLDIEAKEIKTLAMETENIPASDTIETENYKVVIKETELLYDSFENPKLVVYYTYKNKTELSSLPPVSTFFDFIQKDVWLETSIMSSMIEGIDGNALSSDSTEPGDEMLYFIIVSLENIDDPVSLEVYTDEYQCINTLEIPIS